MLSEMFITFPIILLYDIMEYEKETSWIFEIVLFDFYGVLYSVGQMETNGSVWRNPSLLIGVL